MTSVNGGDPIGLSDTDGFVQQTNPFGLGHVTRARCTNLSGINLTGQCIYYDNT